MKSKFIIRNVLIEIIFFIPFMPLVSAQDSESYRYNAVNKLQPVGYWPADEGYGDVLHDRSGNDNQGKIYQVPWDGGLLNFTGAFQWVEIPHHPKYQSRDFAIGGWVFTRREIIGGGWAQRWGMTFIGNGYHSSGFNLDNLYDKRVVFMESQWLVMGGNKAGVSLCIRGDEYVDVISGGKPDILGTRADKIGISIGEWRHILYTYKAGAPIEGGEKWKQLQDWTQFYNAGTGKLYIDGELVKTEENVPFELREQPFLIGSDAVWWLQSDTSGSLNGSVSNIVMFDRELTPHQVQKVFQSTVPENTPKQLIITEDSQDVSDVIGFHQLIETLQDKSLSDTKRANAAIALGKMGGGAKEAAHTLIEVLKEMLLMQGAQLPRVEDIFRNAAINALLNIDTESEQSRKILGLIYAKPILDSVEHSEPYWNDIRPRYEQGNYMDALAIYRKIPLSQNNKCFFSQGDRYRDGREWAGNGRAYTPKFIRNDCIYQVGTGKPWQGVSHVSQEEYTKIAVKLSDEYPEILNWRNYNYKHLYRVPITKISADGTQNTLFLEGENFILDGADEKLRGWSIAMDTKGYIHLVGGMHNAPVPSNYMPGSWERMGVSRDYTSDHYPTMMYWISKEPGCIERLEFAGRRADPRNVPVPLGMNYMNFVQDREGVLYLYGRIYVQGIQSWGLYRYDVDAKSWSGVGGFAPDVKKEFPVWAEKNIVMAADWLSLATLRWKNTAPQNTVLVWARQPHFYNYMRGWGVQFDRNNRMHIYVPIFGLNEQNYNINSDVYAYSDDGGQTFHRADGSKVMLPLTVNPVPERDANIKSKESEKWMEQWNSLIVYAGYAAIR